MWASLRPGSGFPNPTLQRPMGFQLRRPTTCEPRRTT